MDAADHRHARRTGWRRTDHVEDCRRLTTAQQLLQYPLMNTFGSRRFSRQRWQTSRRKSCQQDRHKPILLAWFFLQSEHFRAKINPVSCTWGCSCGHR